MMAEQPSQTVSDMSSTLIKTTIQTIPTITATKIPLNTKSPFHHIPTITFTDTVITTIIPSPYETSKPNLDEAGTSSSGYTWEHKAHQFLPVIIAFAILGVLAVLGCLLFLGCRFYRTSQRRNNDNEDTNTVLGTPAFPKKSILSPGGVLSKWLAPPPTDPPYQQQQVEPIRYEKSDITRINETSSRRPSLAPSWLVRLIPSFFSTPPQSRNSHLPPSQRHRSLPIITQSRQSDAIDNLNIPISSTFVPIDSSSLTLVPRSEIWLDPNRRRGVDELDMWEQRRKTDEGGEEGRLNVHIAPQPILWRFPQDRNAYPDSPEIPAAAHHPFETESARSIHIDTRDSRRSSTTMQGATSYQQIMLEPETSRSETINDPQEFMQSSSVSLPQTAYYQDALSDVRLARTELEKSRLNNSSSRWLHFSGSRSF
ncbi:hypothetical protein K501DRAFT_304330 [Backusella circina FSU 941]|nr:hypothetical protein K501DRAFT_304330 [Backusella circina FSU 941]